MRDKVCRFIGYFLTIQTLGSLFLSKPAAGRRGWNRSAKWSSDGEPITQAEETFWQGESARWTAPPVSCRPLQWFQVAKTKNGSKTSFLYDSALCSLSLSCSSKFVIKQAIQKRVISVISLCFQHALCPPLFLYCLISSSSHTFFPSFFILTLPLIPLCSIVRHCTTYMWLSLCVDKEETQRWDREQWCVQHLNCLFISSHCINYTGAAYKWVHECVCVYTWDEGVEDRSD